jgi:hypothetical protein
MEVDYVRVYSCPKATSSLRTCATKNRRAERNFGNQPPAIIDVEFDPEFIKAEIVDVFNDESVPPFMTGTYVSNGKIDIKEVEEKDRGKVAQITFNTNQGVAYWQGPQGFNFNDFDAIEFDLMRVADPRSSGGLMMKMDCFFPCGTGDVPLDLAPVGEWKSYQFRLRDLVKHPGSSLDLSNVNTPLVIFPNWDNQQGVILRIDNVRFVK